MLVMPGSGNTASEINNLRDIFDIARNSDGVARVECLRAAVVVVKDIQAKLNDHLKSESQQ